MLVLAIAVLVCEHIRRRMWLITSDTKGDPDVAVARADKVVECANLS